MVEGGEADDSGELVVPVRVSFFESLERFVAISRKRVGDRCVRRHLAVAGSLHEIGVTFRVRGLHERPDVASPTPVFCNALMASAHWTCVASI